MSLHGETKAKLYLRRYFRDPRHLDEFVAFFFPHYATSEIPDFHRDLQEAFVSSIDTGINTARAAPRGSAKSTIVGMVLLAYLGIYALRNFVVYLSNTATQAESLLSSLQGEFETNERIIWLYGDLRSKELWNKADFALSTGTRFVAKGQGMKLRGMRWRENRPDLLLFDDLEDDEAVESPIQREKLKRWFLAAALSCLDPESGLAWYIGTILHPDSLLTNICEGRPPFEDWDAKVIKAIQADGTSFWPSRFPLAWLEQKRKELGTFVFNQEYQNEPILVGTRLCPPSYIKPIDHAFVPTGQKSVFFAADPAISKKQTADKSGVVGGSVWRTKLPDGSEDIERIRVTYAVAERLTMLELANRLKSLDELHEPQSIGIESVSYQQGLVEIAEKMGLPAKALKADGDKIRRWNRVSPYFEQGKVEIDPALTDLIRQLLNFNGADGNEDDLVDALVYFVSLCIEKSRADFAIYIG